MVYNNFDKNIVNGYVVSLTRAIQTETKSKVWMILMNKFENFMLFRKYKERAYYIRKLNIYLCKHINFKLLALLVLTE